MIGLSVGGLHEIPRLSAYTLDSSCRNLYRSDPAMPAIAAPCKVPVNMAGLGTAAERILDNLNTHKIRRVCEAFQAVGARLLYLLPYLPAFNPIEQMWSKLKQILCSHAPRTEEELLRAAKIAFQSISRADCQGFFFSAQYAT